MHFPIFIYPFKKHTKHKMGDGRSRKDPRKITTQSKPQAKTKLPLKDGMKLSFRQQMFLMLNIRGKGIYHVSNRHIIHTRMKQNCVG